MQEGAGRHGSLGTPPYLTFQLEFSTVPAQDRIQAAAYLTVEAGPFRFHTALHWCFHASWLRGILGGLLYQAVRIFYNLWLRNIAGFIKTSYLYRANFRFLGSVTSLHARINMEAS
ncbi:uncharacterized protein LOC144587515 isoform X3 [Pogona vitticeps]